MAKECCIHEIRPSLHQTANIHVELGSALVKVFSQRRELPELPELPDPRERARVSL